MHEKHTDQLPLPQALLPSLIARRVSDLMMASA